MADRPKREIKEPKRFCNEYSAYTPVKKVSTRKKDTKLYDIEITEVDKPNKRLKIHYIGYSTHFDEWRPFGDDEGSEYFPFVRKENLFIPSEKSLRDRTKSFHCQLFREIKKRLWSERREDPEINIDLNVNQDVFMEGLGSALPAIHHRGKMVYRLQSIPGTIKYWLGRRSPITEYKIIGEQYVKSEIENSYFITFQFVRGDGNWNNYHAKR